MPLKKFEKNDVFKNVVKTTPFFQFKIYRGNTYINNSLNGNEVVNSMLVTSATTGCSNPNSFDFSCEDNSYNIAAI